MDTPTFFAVNTIDCQPEYLGRFRELFQSRAHAIDRIPGFIRMVVLESTREGEPYLVVSEWDSQAAFDRWTESPEFLEGHRRAFADMASAKARGEAPPMHSRFSTYSVLTR